jgi:hypothetical protein
MLKALKQEPFHQANRGLAMAAIKEERGCSFCSLCFCHTSLQFLRGRYRSGGRPPKLLLTHIYDMMYPATQSPIAPRPNFRQQVLSTPARKEENSVGDRALEP